jgi:hypothetical protein
MRELIAFHGDTIEAFWDEEQQEARVSITSLAQNMGLDGKSQRRKVLAHPVLSKHLIRVMMTRIGGSGESEHLTIPVRFIPTWLNTIMPSRLRPELRARIMLYQEEAADVLAQHFLGLAPRAEFASMPRQDEEPAWLAKYTVYNNNAVMQAMLVALEPRLSRIEDAQGKVLRVDENLRIAMAQGDEATEQRLRALEQRIDELSQTKAEQRDLDAVATVAAGPSPSPSRMVNTVWVFVCNRLAMLGYKKSCYMPIFQKSFEAYMRSKYAPASGVINGGDTPSYDTEDLKEAYEHGIFGTKNNSSYRGDERLKAEMISYGAWQERTKQGKKQGRATPPLSRKVPSPLTHIHGKGGGTESA